VYKHSKKEIQFKFEHSVQILRVRKMKRCIILVCSVILAQMTQAQPVSKFIIIDQFGYLPGAKKIAVIKDPQTGFDSGESFNPGNTYVVVNAVTGDQVYSGMPVIWNSGLTDPSSGDKVWHFDFSSVTAKGSYYVLDEDRNLRSFVFEISDAVYNEVLKHAVRTFFYQRVGFPKRAKYAAEAWADSASHIGPLQDRNCRLFSDKNNPETELDLSGGWYDAGDYNKYTNWTTSYIVEMMKAYIENPSAWGDNYNIPESGNGIPDILDEARWGTDHLLRMQQDDGGVLCIVGESHASPPSAATGQSLYGPATTSASLNTASAFAISSKVYRSLNLISYADTLLARAEKAWDWAVANPAVLFENNSSTYNSVGLGAGQQEETDYSRDMAKLEAACLLFDVTRKVIYREYFDNHYQNAHLIAWNYAYPYEGNVQEYLLYYTTIEDATSSVVDEIIGKYRNAMLNNTINFPAWQGVKDPYLAYLDSYVWGSNQVKASQGNMYHDIITYQIDTIVAGDAGNAALDYIHYIHGVNPLNMTYLSNMYSYGGDNCVNEFYHSWFTNGSAKWDRVGESLYGPPPGYLTGGPNPSYDWDGCCPGSCGSSVNNAICLSESITPPRDQPNQKSYKDFNTSWPLNSWSVTENSCGYQVKYIRLLSKFVNAELDCNGDVEGTAYYDTCCVCVGGQTGREPETNPCNCPNQNLESLINVSFCNSYTSPSSKYTWTESGNYTDTIPSSRACDSIIYIGLTIYRDTDNMIDTSVCYSYTSPSGKYTWYTSGSYMDTIANSAGCDSVLSIELTVIEVNTSVIASDSTLTAGATGVSYQWLDCNNSHSVIADATSRHYSPSATGSYAVEITQGNCADTSECYPFELTGIIQNSLGDQLKVFPNPASGSVTIILPDLYDIVEIGLSDTAGNTIEKDIFENKKEITVLYDHPGGMYFMTIRYNRQQKAVIRLLLE
jgi:endoglucanase